MSFVLLDQRDHPGWGSEGSCTGECCRTIMVNLGPEDIAYAAARQNYARRMGRNVPPGGDCDFAVKHLIPMGRSYDHPDSGKRINEPAPRVVYRCDLWDGRTRRCTAYEERPHLCSGHGIETQCGRPGCTLRPYRISRDWNRWEDDGGRVG